MVVDTRGEQAAALGFNDRPSDALGRQLLDFANDLIDRGTVVWPSAGIAPGDRAVGRHQHVATQLQGVFFALCHSSPASKQRGVTLDHPPAIHPPHAASLVANAVVERELLVGHHGERIGKAPAVASQIAGLREGHDHNIHRRSVFGVKFISSIAHGADMGLTRQSGQVTVEDHQQRAAAMVCWLPRRSVMPDKGLDW